MGLGEHQHVDSTLGTVLKFGSGICWTITYVLILKKGFRDKSYGMPMAALCANLSWEFIFSFIFPHTKPQLYIDYTWLIFDLGLLVQFLYFASISKDLFLPSFVLTFLLCFSCIMLISYEYEDFRGIYAAFGQNLMMSVLFISMAIRRNSTAGQSTAIAIFKMIGTLFASVLFYLYFPNSKLLIFLYASILLMDMIYCVLMYKWTAQGK